MSIWLTTQPNSGNNKNALFSGLFTATILLIFRNRFAKVQNLSLQPFFTYSIITTIGDRFFTLMCYNALHIVGAHYPAGCSGCWVTVNIRGVRLWTSCNQRYTAHYFWLSSFSVFWIAKNYLLNIRLSLQQIHMLEGQLSYFNWHIASRPAKFTL